MPIYDKSGNQLHAAFGKSGTTIGAAYDIDGTQAFPSSDPYLPGRTLVFEDDFNGTALNTDNWGYELGNVRNNELQTYRAENNVSVADGCLVITAKKEDFGYTHWTSGSITGQHKKEFTYGRFEAKVKVPNVAGAFPAFWMMGTSMENVYHEIGDNDVSGEIWPKCGEIDIFEYTKNNRDRAKGTVWTYTGGFLGGSQILSPVTTPTDWHIYSCEWTEDYIKLYLDEELFATWNFSDYSYDSIPAYFLPFYMLIDLAVGGFNGDDPPASSTTEMKMYVDWVRVYAPLNGS